MKFLPLVWKNLFRRKARTLFTVLSIVVAFILFGYLAAVRVAFGGGVQIAGVDRLLVIHKVSLIQMLPESYQGRIEVLDGIADISHQTWFGGIYQDPRNFFAQFAVDPESYLRLYPEMVLSDAERETWLGNRTGAIVDRATADRFGWQVGDRIPLQGTIWRTRNDDAWEFTIDGIFDFEGGGQAQFFFHYEYLAEANTLGRGLVGQYVIRIDEPARAADIAAAVDARFANSGAETKTSTEQAFLQGFADQIGNIGAIVTAILATVFFTILVITANTMAQSIRERTSELAVLKTLGFTGRRVMTLVVLESMALAATGGAAGLGIVYVLVGQGDPTGGFLPAFAIPARDLLVGGVLVVGLGVASAVLPGWQATRLRIVDALRKV